MYGVLKGGAGEGQALGGGGREGASEDERGQSMYGGLIQGVHMGMTHKHGPSAGLEGIASGPFHILRPGLLVLGWGTCNPGGEAGAGSSAYWTNHVPNILSHRRTLRGDGDAQGLPCNCFITLSRDSLQNHMQASLHTALPLTNIKALQQNDANYVAPSCLLAPT
jgi:hypothetical protein